MDGALTALPRRFYDRDVVRVARDTLGKLLIRSEGKGLCIGRIVEVEAYLAAGDPACHASRGRTNRNASMFGPPGHAYVYTIHTHHCLNLVTEPEGVASAVLIRAVEPLEGIERMKQRRGTDNVRLLAAGPGRLCQAFAIDGTFDAHDLVPADLCAASGPSATGRTPPVGGLWLSDDGHTPPAIATSGRIGIRLAAELPLRFFIRDHRFVSRSRGSAGPPAAG